MARPQTAAGYWLPNVYYKPTPAPGKKGGADDGFLTSAPWLLRGAQASGGLKLRLCHAGDLGRAHRRRNHLQTRARYFLFFRDRALPEAFEPAVALDDGLGQTDHAIELVKNLVVPQRILPVGYRLDEVERVIKAGIAQIDVKLLTPWVRDLRWRCNGCRRTGNLRPCVRRPDR